MFKKETRTYEEAAADLRSQQQAMKNIEDELGKLNHQQRTLWEKQRFHKRRIESIQSELERLA